MIPAAAPPALFEDFGSFPLFPPFPPPLLLLLLLVVGGVLWVTVVCDIHKCLHMHMCVSVHIILH